MRKPLVSVGMPVYNGENFIEEALDSILNQTLTDFELIICDNASTDSTPEICQRYAAKDSRINYYANEINVGAAKNYNRTFELASGKYFKWAAHDDICAPEFLERCVEKLEQDSSITLCYPKTSIIDEHGDPYLIYIAEVDTSMAAPHQRLYEMINTEHWCFQVFGVFRATDLAHTKLIAPFSGSDRVLLAEICLYGKVEIVEEELFLRREHPNTSTRVYTDNKSMMAWFDPTKKDSKVSPLFLKYFGYMEAVHRIQTLSWAEKFRCYWVVNKMLAGKMYQRLTRKLSSNVSTDRSHLAIPVEGKVWH